MTPRPPQCYLTAFQLERDILVRCSGRLRLEGIEVVRSDVQSLLTSGIDNFYLDIEHLDEIDSSGLGLLVGLHITARRHAVNFVLLSPSAEQMRLLETTRLIDVLAIHSGLQAAQIRSRLVSEANRIASNETAGT